MNQTEELRYECEWSKIDWNTAEWAVFQLQKRICRASLNDNKKGVRHLQGLLLASKQTKLLAVRRVTQDNKGKNTPGVDQALYTFLLSQQFRSKRMADQNWGRTSFVEMYNLSTNLNPLRTKKTALLHFYLPR